jgi:hypothetical protein
MFSSVEFGRPDVLPLISRSSRASSRCIGRKHGKIRRCLYPVSPRSSERPLFEVLVCTENLDSEEEVMKSAKNRI